MPAQKKQVKKTEQTENKPKTFSAIVSSITERNELIVTTKENKTERLILAHVDVPRFNKKDNKEEIFAYECGEFLRKKLIGKSVKFEVVSEIPDGPKTVIPTFGQENVIVSLLAQGYAVLKEGRSKHIEEFAEAESAAKREKKGFYAENPEKLCKKRPQEAKMTTKDLDFYVNKTLKGYIRKVESPATLIVEGEDRKFVRVLLMGVHQHAPFDAETNKFKFDAIAIEAMKYVERVFGMRDCEVKITENGQKVRGVVTVGEKDIAEQLLLNGYVTLAISNESDLKKKYEAAETKAQNEKKGRFADEATLKEIREKKEKKEKALSDRIKNAKIVTGFVKHIGKFIRIEQEDGKEVVINFASVRPVYKKDDAKFNKAVEMRMRECVRKQIAGKKVECKLAYTQTYKKEEKEFSEDYYDVYANGKNVAIQLLKEGLVTLDNKKQDVLKQSFDFALLKQTQSPAQPKISPVVEYTPDNVANVKDFFLDSKVFTCAIEKVISLTKYVIYVPAKDCTVAVSIKGVRVPKAGKECSEFVDKAKNVVARLVQYQDATVTFEAFNKKVLYADIDVKAFGSIQQYLTEKGYAIPTGKVVLSAEVEEMKANKLNIYQFDEQKAQKEVKEEEEKKPKRYTDIKFSAEEKVFLTGYDGEKVYFYNTKEETAFVEEMSNEIKAIKRGKYELKLGKGFAVEYKGKMYRAEVLSMNNGANLVRCVDTGATFMVGKNKIRSIPEEVANKEVKVSSKKLLGIKPLSLKDSCYKKMLEVAAEFYGQEATIASFSDEAKVVVGEVCLNVHMIANGVSLIDRRFFDKGEFGTALKEAEAKAKEEHVNAWQFGEIYDEDDKQRD